MQNLTIQINYFYFLLLINNFFYHQTTSNLQFIITKNLNSYLSSIKFLFILYHKFI